VSAVKRALGWVIALCCLAVPLFVAPSPHPDRSGPSAFVAPAAELLTRIEWVRFERERRAGHPIEAIARARAALTWSPRDPAGWDVLATHLGLTLASAERESDPDRRRAWLEAGLQIAREGESVVREPMALAWTTGLLLLVHGETDPDLAWPGGTAGILSAASDAFERAASLGHPDGEAAASYARALARLETPEG